MNPWAQSDRPLSVMIVDPAGDTAESTAELLSLYGYACRTAGCGAAALAASAAHPPDVVVTELLLGEMDGCELARRLRALPGEKRPLLVALTVCGREEDRCRSAGAGFALHLVKPVEPAILVGLVRRFDRLLLRPVGCPGDGGGDPVPSPMRRSRFG